MDGVLEVVLEGGVEDGLDGGLDDVVEDDELEGGFEVVELSLCRFSKSDFSSSFCNA